MMQSQPSSRGTGALAVPGSTHPGAVSAAGTRFGGLDGLRAIAVAMVLVYHAFPSALPGGFLGVDLFFVISGFLIASLLLRELDRYGRIRLLAFWRRRARRLLPALALVLLVCSGAALLVGGDVLVGIGAQIVGSALFVSNWVFIGRGVDYFAHTDPELFRNTWSLAIEEQFYLVLPLLLVLACAMRSRSWRAMPFVVLSIASAGLMAALALDGAEPTRIYFGSDTHTFGLFAGVSLALLLRGDRAPDLPTRRGLQTVTALSALLGLGVVAWLALTLREGSPESFTGGFQLATLAALLTVWAITRPGARIGRLLDARPLRYVGERSYGIYLWHWPVLVLLAAAPTPWAGGSEGRWITGLLALAITMPLAILSYRFVEQPVRRHGLRRAFGIAIRPLRLPAAQRVVAATLLAVLIVTVPATIAAVVVAPERSSAAEAVARGRAALEGQQGQGQQPQPRPSSGAVAGAPRQFPGPGQTPDPSPSPEPAPPSLSITGDQIWAIGDSVMLASAGELSAQWPGIVIDADVSRSFIAGVRIVEARAPGGLPPVLVVGLGTNGPVVVQDLDWLLALSPGCRIVLVNAHGDRWWIPDVNRTLADFAAAHRGVVLADWDSAIVQASSGLAGDGIHPDAAGAQIYTQTIQQALDALNLPEEQPTGR